MLIHEPPVVPAETPPYRRLSLSGLSSTATRTEFGTDPRFGVISEYKHPTVCVCMASAHLRRNSRVCGNPAALLRFLWLRMGIVMSLLRFRTGSHVRFRALAAGLAVALGLSLIPAGAAAAADSTALLSLTKEIAASTTNPLVPGGVVNYRVALVCSNLEPTGCVDAAITDTIPAPLVLNPGSIMVSGTPAAVSISGNTFTVTFTEAIPAGGSGMIDGNDGIITYSATLPLTVSGDANGVPLVNTATATASNATNSPLSRTATITPVVPQTLISTATKLFDPTTVTSVPGTPVALTLGASNASNQSVDTLVVQDPAETAATNPFEFLRVTGITTLTPPAGADSVQVQWLDGSVTPAVWTPLPTAVAVPSDLSTLLPTTPSLDDVIGARVIFSSSGGGVIPTTPTGGQATITLATALRDNVDTITADMTVNNLASSWVTKGSQTSSPVDAPAALAVTVADLGPELSKQFSDTVLVPGDQSVATIESQNGDFEVERMTIVEPAPGEASLPAQGLRFDGFVQGDVEWPIGATAAEFSYQYDDALSTTPTTLTDSSTPLPTPEAGRTVLGFSISFTGVIRPSAYAVLPFTVTALAVSGTDDVTSRNIAWSQVERADGATDQTTAFADTTRTPARVNTTVSKSIVPTIIWAVPGSGSLVRLLAKVNSRDDDPSSTVGAHSLTVQDPANPTATVDAYWDRFNLTGIAPTAIPANATLDAQYWDGTAWLPLPGATGVVGPVSSWTVTVDPLLRDSIQGIRLVLTPTVIGATFPPAFEFAPNLRTELRSTLRSNPSVPAVDPASPTDVVVDNLAASTVSNVFADPATATDTDDASITVRPTQGGPGVSLGSKAWIDPAGEPPTVAARTEASATARISWGTQYLPLTTVRVSDPAPVSSTATGLPAVQTTIYDAFDVIAINPITPSQDPLIAFDAVTGVFYFSDTTDTWVDITTDVCGAVLPGACDGTFPGVTLSDAQSADAVGIRIEFSESPTRSTRATGPTDPAVGTGVAGSETTRPIDLEFRLRDERRSDGAAVTGRDVYNLAPATGIIDNTARIDGLVGTTPEYTTVDGDEIVIQDVPLNVSVTKNWTYGPYGLPPVGTPLDRYPVAVATVSATNETAARVNTLMFEDPNPDSVVESAFERLNLVDIVSVSVPSGTAPGGSTVTLEFFTGPSPITYSIADAEALDSTVLANATSITVRHDGRIDSGASTTAVMAFQLRATLRSDPSTDVLEGDVPDNTVLATVLDPGGTVEFNGSKTAQTSDDIPIEAPTYGVDAVKSISPDSAYEDESNRAATVTISGQPSGTVRTTSLTLTDDEATFWNAYTFTGFQPITLQAPITRVAVEALVGVDFTVVLPVNPGDPETIVTECNGDTDLEPCWMPVGTYTGAPGSTVTPTLPGSILPADVLGLRYTVDRADGANWERPYNPRQVVSFTTERRVDLVTGGPVPSTRPTIPVTDPAPGETVLGRTTDTVDVHAVGSWNRLMSPAVVWTADDAATDSIDLLHRSNGVRIVKTPTGNVAPGTPIPFQIAVTNTGAWNMTGLAVSDSIETDGPGDSPRLVVPEVFPGDAPVFTYELRNAGSVLQVPAPDITATVSPDGATIDFATPTGFVLPAGWTLTITANLMLRADIVANSSVGNSATATSDRVFDSCVGATNTVLNAPTLAVAECATSTVVNPVASSPLQILKSVKGDGAGLIDAAPGDANYNDLGVLALPASPSVDYCATPNGPDGYYRNPCVPITRPGGTELWRSYVTNVGNIPSARVSMIDVLPHPNDRGVIIDQDRSSRWTPEFTGDLVIDVVDASNAHAAVATAEVRYLTAAPVRICNRLDVVQGMLGRPVTAADLEPGEPASCVADVNSRNWQVYDEATPDLASVAALKVVVSYADANPSVVEGLEPGETMTLSYSSTTAPFAARAETADRDSIAWNSIAGGALGIDPSDDQEYVSQVREARKTGVAMAQGKLDFTKIVDTPLGYPFATPTSFQFTVVCESVGENVPLVGIPVGSNPAPDRSAVTLTPGTELNYNSGVGSGTWANVNLPLYAECSLEEAPSQGATVTYAPSTPVIAYRTYATRTDVANKPAADEIAPDGILSIDATNTYEYAGFTVSKTADPGTAVDQDGVVIERPGPYSFTAVCTFLGGEVLRETFTVAAGASHSEPNLPAGASCTVTENAAGGASLASTEMLVTTGGSDVEVAGKSATFTLSPNTGFAGNVINNTVDVTNTFPTGTIQIAKTVSGPGGTDWGNASFGVRLVCTTTDALPTTVYDDVLTISKASPTVTVSNLASGATCTISETAQGGANVVTITPTTVVVDSTPESAQVVNVFNTFRVGTVRVTKVLSGSPANSLAPATGFDYEVSLACTRVVNGDTVSVVIPGGATRTITGAGTADYTGLPTGASCTVSETVDGHATSATLTPTDGTVIVGNGTTVGVTVTNAFANGSVSVHKSVSGAAESFAPTEFVATVSCEWQGTAVPLANDGEITLTDDETVTLNNVPVGSICSVTEEDAGQALPNPSTPATVTVTDGTTPTVTLELSNVYNAASLRVTKTVTSDASPVPTEFGFHVRCEFLEAEVLDVEFTLDAGAFRDFTGLPARSVCEIEETNARAADDTIVSGTSATGTVFLDQDARFVAIDELASDAGTDGPRNTATFENLYGVAGLVITKELDGAGAAQFGLGETFPVRVVCVYDDETLLDETVNLVAGTSPSHSWSDLVAGSECTITEADLNGADAVVIAPNDGDTTTVGTVTVADGTAAQVTVTNWYLTGSVEVTKYFEGDAAEKFGTRTYPVQLTCERDDEEIVFTNDGIRSLSSAAPTVTFGAIPTGSACELVELSTGGATSTRIIDATTGDDGPTLVEPATGAYGFTITTSTATLAATDQPQMPLGVVNHFDFATVSATKVVDTTAIDAEGEPVAYGPFEVELVCTLAGEPVEAAEDAVRSIAAGETISWTELPVDAACTIEETETEDASSASVQLTQGDDTGPVVPGTTAAFGPLVGLDSVNAAELVNVFEVGSVTVAKVVNGTEPSRANGPFPVTLACILIDASHPFPGLLVRDVEGLIGGPESLVFTEENIPSGSECIVTETDAGTANHTSIAIDASIETTDVLAEDADDADAPGTKPTVIEGKTASFTLEPGVISAATITVTNTFDLPLQNTGSGDLPIGLAILGFLGLGGGLLLLRRPSRGRHAR